MLADTFCRHLRVDQTQSARRWGLIVCSIVIALSVPAVRADLFVVTNTDDAGAGSLRQAIIDANQHSGLDTISFNISGAGVHTIAPASNFPAITDPAIIDGYTQPGAAPNTNGPAAADNAVLRIVLDGTGSNPNLGDGDGLVITGGGSTVRGLVINGFARAATGGGGRGILLQTKGGNKVQGNFIGTDTTGTAAVPNGEEGVLIANAADNIIGGVDPAERNVISGNLSAEVVIQSASATGNRIQGNLLGTDAAGTTAIGSGNARGVLVDAPRNTIGGTVPAARNVIAGHNSIGIDLRSNDNAVQGNFIGTSLDGAAAIPNATGVFVVNSSGNVIGGTSPGAGNLISGNTFDGVQLAYGTAVA